jgi:type VI secretion system protein ImpL
MYLTGLVTATVCVAGVLFVWWRKARSRKKPAPAADPGGVAAPPAAAQASKLVDDLFREANNRLKLAPKMKGASVASLPAFLIVGPQGAGKTSVMAHSGLDPELLAGQVYQGTETAPTATLNIWLARQQVIFIEVSTSFATDANALKAILRRLTPSGIGPALRKEQPPRGFLLCTNQAPIAAAATPDEITALARPWNECLSLAASALGVQLAVYVLFTKMDGLPGFAEFVSNLGPGESVQAVGAATRPFKAETGGAYAEETSRLLNQHFANIAYALCDSRVPLLRREQNRARLALEYQFPREFQRLQKNLVQFLVAVGRPSQLQVSAFLRGFYFCGTRKVAVDRPGRQAAAAPAPTAVGALAATTVLNPAMIRAQMAAAQPGAEAPPAGAEITEWLFVPSVFESVLLRDRTARGVSTTSLRTDRMRALAFALLGILGLVVAAGLTTSYVRNRLLEKELVAAGTADPLQRLEQLRQSVKSLLDDRSDTPLGMKWGLYQGNDLLPPARTIYCSAMKSQVLQPLVGKMKSDLAAIRTSGVAPRSSFAVLKAYMMMTTNPEHADGAFLADQLSETRNRTQEAAISPEAAQQLRYQLLLYGDLLKVPNSKECLFDPGGVVPTAQEYLRTRNLDDDLYQSFLARAGTGVQAVNYDETYSNNAVSDGFRVPGYFTKQGWAKMQDLLKHPESLRTDAWVLGKSQEFSQEELSRKADGYHSRYVNEYAQAWKTYLGSATIATYKGLDDAAAKLDKMLGPQSCLLNLIGIAAQHTSSIEEMKAVFQPAATVASAPGSFQPETAEYQGSLGRLKNKLPNDAQQGSAQDQNVTVRNAVDQALDSVEHLASSFRGDSETYQAVKNILLKPITNVPPLLVMQDADAENDKGKSLCKSYAEVSRLFPLYENPQASLATLDQLQTVFDNQQPFRHRLDCDRGGCSETSPKPMYQKKFKSFFSGLNNWSNLLSSGGQLGRISLSMEAKQFNGLKTLVLSIDGRPVTLQAGGEAVTVPWDVRSSQELRLAGDFDAGREPNLFSPNHSGPWALFDWIFDSEDDSHDTGVFHWVPMSGRTTKQYFSDNKTSKEYKIEIDWPDKRALSRRSLAVGSCVQPMAK